MRFHSTLHPDHMVPLRQAVLEGLPKNGGLYVPASIPPIDFTALRKDKNLPLDEIAIQILTPYLEEDLPADVIRTICAEAFNFNCPVVKVEENIFSLELYHGPTWAFKDFGARFMSRLFAYFLEGTGSKTKILVATSGDTGGAVGHGFLNNAFADVVILFPKGKVSELQKRQLTTLGHNIEAIEIDGTFDDCQDLVKKAFLDSSLQNLNLSSANSINIARLLPQMVYYVHAAVRMEEDFVFSVPSGNFGNLTAGIMASMMGMPAKAFLAATNINHIVPDYLNYGAFMPASSKRTLSNAMDVGAPNNFPRLHYLLKNWTHFQHRLKGYYYQDQEVLATIKKTHHEHQYLLEPHGAIGYQALKDYLSEHPGVKGVFLETAHPVKFADTVFEATGIQPGHGDADALMKKKPEYHTLSSSYRDFREWLKA